MQIVTYPPYFSTGDRQTFKQACLAILLALLLHGLVLLVVYFRPANNAPIPRETIDVSLESLMPETIPQPKTHAPTIAPPAVEPPKKMAEPIPTLPTESPTPSAPPVAEPQPAPVVPPTVVAEPSQNNTPREAEVQPLFKLNRLPSFSKKVEAVYPTTERRAGVQANVLAEVTIDEQGRVVQVRILKSGGSAFDDAVKQALQQSLFNPGMMDGKPVGTRFQIPFRFNLN